MNYDFRLLDFQGKDEIETVELVDEVYNEKNEMVSKESRNICGNKFTIQMFGVNEKGETCSIFVDDYQPYFYIRVSNNWNNRDKDRFFKEIKKKIGKIDSR